MVSEPLTIIRQREPWQPSAQIEILRQRALTMRRVRDWFQHQNILEVETPALSAGATTDPHIDSFTAGSAAPQGLSTRCLRTSAEFHLKRLLVAGCGDVYELGKVFRVDECGRYHNPEFTMLEWYRCGLSHHELVDDVEQLLSHLHSDRFPGLSRISYRDLWRRASSIDVARRNCSDVVQFLQKHGCDVPGSITDDFDALLDLGMGTVISDGLSKDQYTCIYNYPASQAALARIDNTDSRWSFACRFEIYFGAVELANGYHELTDPVEQRTRFESDNSTRHSNGQVPMPVDVNFLSALENGLPDCAGVAIGIDRLLMVLLDIDSLDQVVSFAWERA